MAPVSHQHFAVRGDLAESHERLLSHIADPGTWWSGAERRAIAEEARAARSCALCAQRKAAVSPFAVDGTHDGPGSLHPVVVDTVHRIVTDPGRLANSWYQRTIDADPLDAERYVELIGVTVFITAIDVFCRAIGAAQPDLPPARPGEPTGSRPGSRDGGAWVPQLLASDPEWTRLYGDRTDVAQVERGLSLVPAEVHELNTMAEAHYMTFDHVADPTYNHPERSIDRLQTELVAARVSAINECFY